jgi:hypothetical protein
MTGLVFFAAGLVGGYYGGKHRKAFWHWLNTVGGNPVPPL